VPVLQFGWNPASPMRANTDLRQAISSALQGDRTMDSIVPPGCRVMSASFSSGPGDDQDHLAEPIKLTLATTHRAERLGRRTQIRSRLEDSGGLSIQLRPDPAAGTSGWLTARRGPRRARWLQP
jgi:peptide/nickel transport system substrate-binding protein